MGFYCVTFQKSNLRVDIDIWKLKSYIESALYIRYKGKELLSIPERVLSDMTGVLVANL